MNARELVRSSTYSMVQHAEHHGVVPSLVGIGVGAGMSELTGFLIGRYHDELQKTRVPVPLVVGGLLQLGSIFLQRPGRGLAARVGIASMRALGDAGTNTFFALDGVARGYASVGRSLFFGKDKDQQRLPDAWTGTQRLWGQPQGQTQVGAIPQAGPGDWLDGPGLRHYASKSQ